jgi:hypothetical protein
MPGVVRGTVRYNVPDDSVRPEDRGLFSGPAHKYAEDVDVDLYDPATTPDIVQGPEGLDVQGFTYVKHRSALTLDQWMTGHLVEEIYIPEVEQLVREVTKAKKVIVNHLGIRKRLAANNVDPTFYRKAGDQHDQAVKEYANGDSAWGKAKTHLYAAKLTDSLQYLGDRMQVLSRRALRTVITLSMGSNVRHGTVVKTSKKLHRRHSMLKIPMPNPRGTPRFLSGDL